MPTTHFFEVPFPTSVPDLARPGSGVATVELLGADHSYDVEVTILDSVDARLMRNGVLCARRVIDGHHQWYLAAPQWAPQLPAEQVWPVDGDDVPDHLMKVLIPFLRGEKLTELAVVSAERRGYAARDDQQSSVARLRGERVTNTVAGLTRARYREVTVKVRTSTADAVRSQLLQSLQGAGSTPMPSLPTLVQRIGAPATGVPDLPRVKDWQAEDSVERFVTALLATRVHELFRSTLAGGDRQVDPADVAEQIFKVSDDLRGLEGILTEAWPSHLATALESQVTRHPSATTVPPALMERLVAAARAPQLGDRGRRGAAAVVGEDVSQRIGQLIQAGKALGVDEPDPVWRAAANAAQRAAWAGRLWHVLTGPKGRTVDRRLNRMAALLLECSNTPTEPDPAEYVDASVEEAFRRGRAFERALAVQADARRDFLAGWRARRRKLEKAM